MTADHPRQRRRRGYRAAAALAATAICAGSASLAATPAEATPRSFWGAVIQHSIGGPDFKLMRKAGIGTIRVLLHWPSVQRNAGRCQAGAQVGVCDWRAYDGYVGALARDGIETFPYVLNSPPFVSSDPAEPPIGSRRDKRAWQSFLRALVERYGRGGRYWRTEFRERYPGAKPRPIRNWQIWNEPSGGSYWQPAPDPRDYAKLVKLSGRAIHSTDRRARVVLAGLFGTPPEAEGGIDAPRYYRKLFAVRGIGRFFDDAAVHPYGPRLQRVRLQIDWLRDSMRRAGFQRRHFWITETGWSSGDRDVILGKTPSGQAKMLTKALGLFESKRRKWKLRGVHWYAWQDLPRAMLCEFCFESGLVTFERERKPAYRAYRRIAR